MHVTNCKKPVWKGCTVYGSNCMIFCKRQNYRDRNRSVVTMGWGEGRINRWSTENFRAVKLLCVTLQWWTHVIIHLSKPTECTTPRLTLNANYGLWVMTMQVYHLTKGGNVENGAGCAYGDSLYFPPQLCFEPKTALKNKVFWKKHWTLEIPV